jgi:hypothetical protein
MAEGQSVLFEASWWPRRTLLPDPSELSEFDTSGILSRAEAFAAQHDVDAEVKS